jgi:hypothetical protein
MAKSKSSPKPPGKPKFGLSTWITLAIVLPIFWVTFNGFRKWSGVRKRMATFDTEVAARNKRNAELKKVFDATGLKRFEACNKGADQITINWVTAAYHDGKNIKIFDSDRCREWQPIVLAAGDNKMVLLRTAQAGCNWNGDVFYYAMKYTQESEEKINSYHVVGPYQGFDRDCYTFVG